jgi:hypothetical protein
MTSTESPAEKARKERSPSFPFIPLGKAVDRARAFAEAHRRSPARLATVADTWGYAQNSSGLQQTAAALKGYGLMEDVGKGQDRRVNLTDLGWRILHDERPGARETAIREAALRPRLFAEYAGQWLPERPSDNHCISELHLDRGFTQGAAELFLRVFDETAAFANLKNGDNLSPSLEKAEPDVPAVESAPVRTRLHTMQADADPYRLAFTQSGGIEVTGRLNTEQEVADLIRSLEALKLLFKRVDSVQRPDDPRRADTVGAAVRTGGEKPPGS